MKAEQPKPIPLPAVLVYGKLASSTIPQASWFRIEDRAAVIAAAHGSGLIAVDIAAGTDQSLFAGVHEGVLKGNNRIIAGSTTPEVYRRLEDWATTKAAHIEDVHGENGRGSQLSKEQIVNNTKNPPTLGVTQLGPTPAPDPWDALRTGSYVLAKHWENDGNPYGWWIAVIKNVENGDFVVRWMDDPLKPAFKLERKHIALLHPSFDVAREWEKRR